jgi:sodium-coupled monocarboxylate transporter 8/12
MTSLSILTCFSGLVIYYFYHTCDPLKSGRITVRDQNMPLYVVDAIGHIPGLAGLFVSGIFAAGLSSISSSLNALAAITVEDYFKPAYLAIKKKQYSPSPTKSALISKFVAAIYGCITIGLAFLAQNLG